MNKAEFIKKNGLTELDYKNLVRYENVRKSGVMNMWGYIYLMRNNEVNGGTKLADLITGGDFYGEFLETLKGE